MILKEYFNYDQTFGGVKEAQIAIREVLNELSKDFEDKALTPRALYFKYFGNDGAMTAVGHSLIANYPLNCRGAERHSSDFLMTKLRQFNLSDWIAQNNAQSNIIQVGTWKVIKKYDRNVYWDICRLGAAMLVQKYGCKTLYPEHLLYEIITLLFRCFKVYDKYEESSYLIKLDDIYNFYYSLLYQITVEDLNSIAKKFEFEIVDEFVMKVPVYHGKQKPESKEQILELFQDVDITTLSQTDIIARIKKWYPLISERTIRRQLAKFGLTNKKYERADYKEIHEHLDEVAADVMMEIADVKSEIKQEIFDVESQVQDVAADVKSSVNESTERIISSLTNLFTIDGSKSTVRKPSNICSFPMPVNPMPMSTENLFE